MVLHSTHFREYAGLTKFCPQNSFFWLTSLICVYRDLHHLKQSWVGSYSICNYPGQVQNNEANHFFDS